MFNLAQKIFVNYDLFERWGKERESTRTPSLAHPPGCPPWLPRAGRLALGVQPGSNPGAWSKMQVLQSASQSLLDPTSFLGTHTNKMKFTHTFFYNMCFPWGMGRMFSSSIQNSQKQSQGQKEEHWSPHLAVYSSGSCTSELQILWGPCILTFMDGRTAKILKNG